MDTGLQLYQKLFNWQSEDLNTEALEKLVEEYPYCSVTQFYLLHNYTKNDAAKAAIQAQKTALFFSNTNWLDWQLHVMSQPDIKIVTEVQPAAGVSGQHDAPLVPFEPLHTVDYFASQGIRVTDEPVSTDKLGKQLKSFTEWLKSMKKVHAERLEEGNDLSDKKIQTIAEVSNSSEEVVTEAMAEVLSMQGKIEKAIDTYEKLSLINPAKSAYFAAKIVSLKAL